MTEKFQLSQINNDLKEKLEKQNEVIIFDNREPAYLARKISDIERKTEKEKYLFMLFISILFLCTFLTILNGYIVAINSDHSMPVKWEEWGGFGSVFGGLNTLFSGTALAGIVYTMFLQRRAVGLQQEELKDIKTQLGMNKQQYEDSRQEYEQAKKEYEQTVILNSKSILLNAYNQQIQWHIEETRLRRIGQSVLEDTDFRNLTRYANDVGKKRQNIIKDIEDLVRQVDPKSNKNLLTIGEK